MTDPFVLVIVGLLLVVAVLCWIDSWRHRKHL